MIINFFRAIFILIVAAILFILIAPVEIIREQIQKWREKK